MATLLSSCAVTACSPVGKLDVTLPQSVAGMKGMVTGGMGGLSCEWEFL